MSSTAERLIDLVRALEQGNLNGLQRMQTRVVLFYLGQHLIAGSYACCEKFVGIYN